MRSMLGIQQLYPGANAFTPGTGIPGNVGTVVPGAQASVQPSSGTGIQSYGASQSMQSNGVPITQVFPQLYQSVLGAPLLWLFGLIGLLILYKLIEEHRGGREAFGEIKIGLNNVIKIGLAAVIFIVVAKFLFTRYQVPGLSPLFKAA